jgi:hypothetical protein
MLYISIYLIGIYLLFGLLTYRDLKKEEEGHPFFNIRLSYLWPLIAILTPFGLLFYVIYKWINRKNHK